MMCSITLICLFFWGFSFFLRTRKDHDQACWSLEWERHFSKVEYVMYLYKLWCFPNIKKWKNWFETNEKKQKHSPFNMWLYVPQSMAFFFFFKKKALTSSDYRGFRNVILQLLKVVMWVFEILASFKSVIPLKFFVNS
jgi:hypothetical protein